MYCNCIVDSHHEGKYNCLNLRCDCPEVHHVPKPKADPNPWKVKDNKPHVGSCDCAACKSWHIRQWSWP